MSEPIPAQRYGPTSGFGSGIVGLVICALVLLAAVLDHGGIGALRVGLAAALGAVLVWAYLVRPRIVIEEGGRTVLLRNPFVDHRVPLAAVKVVGVRTVTTIKTDDGHRYDAVAVGHSIRKVIRGRTAPEMSTEFGRQLPSMPVFPPPAKRTSRPTDLSTPDLMTEQILFAADRARELGYPTEPAERRFALPELVLSAVLVVALAVSFAL